MPLINDYKCTKCDLTLPRGWGYYFYVADESGKGIVCGHPGERSDVEKVLGKNAPLEIIRDRTGFNSHCMCLDCLHQFVADLGVGKSYWSPFEDAIARYKPRPREGRDKKQCPKCRSTNVKTELEMVGEICPKCKEGIIERIWTGRIS